MIMAWVRERVLLSGGVDSGARPFATRAHSQTTPASNVLMFNTLTSAQLVRRASPTYESHTP